MGVLWIVKSRWTDVVAASHCRSGRRPVGIPNHKVGKALAEAADTRTLFDKPVLVPVERNQIGGMQNATHRIPGLDAQTAQELRDRLVEAANRRMASQVR